MKSRRDGVQRSFLRGKVSGPAHRTLRQRNNAGRRRRDPQPVTPAELLNTTVSDVLMAHPAAAGVFVGHGFGVRWMWLFAL
jgi:hypothetical protein